MCSYVPVKMMNVLNVHILVYENYKSFENCGNEIK